MMVELIIIYFTVTLLSVWLQVYRSEWNWCTFLHQSNIHCS